MALDASGGQALVTPFVGSSGTADTKIAFTRGSLKYDSPFLDMTSSFLPRTIKAILRFIAAYVVGDGLISACVHKMAEYPITGLLYNDEVKGSLKDDKSIEYWKDVLERKLKIRRSLKQAGMDYYAYGNSLMSIHYPFKRHLECPKCGSKHASTALKAKFKNYKFYASCINNANGKKCQYDGEMKAYDTPTKELDKMSIVHWDIMNMDIKYNNITGDHFYFYTVPVDLANSIRRGDMDIIRGTRLEVIEAVRKRKQLKLMADNIFHLKRPGPQYIIPSERGWGIPIVMPVMKDIFHNRVLKKGNEMISFDHIVPLRILFPQGTGDVSPHATISLSGWKNRIEAELQKWRVDPNYISIMPLPLGMENFSGDARLLLVTPEIKMCEDNIIIGMGIIPEIIRGGASWSGSNVSLRVVENSFLNHRDDIQELIDWIIEKVSNYLDKPPVEVRMSDFKMADDMAKKELMLKASSGATSDNLVSRETATQELGFDPDKEFKRRQQELKKLVELKVQEAEGMAEAQGAGALIAAVYQADSQIDGQERFEMRQGQSQQKRDERNSKASEINAGGVQQDAQNLAGAAGMQPEGISIPNLILVLTQRFARLAAIDRNEFKIRMLAMKNSTPNLYQEIYTNLKEMNLIEADLAPDIASVDKYTPGQVPVNQQGGTYAEGGPNAAEAGGAPASMVLPEAAPPRSPNSPI